MNTQMKKKVVRMMATMFLITVTGLASAAQIELDGNAVSNGGVDWDTINATGSSGQTSAETDLIVDKPEPVAAQFTGGGSKDQLDITEWKWRGGNPPDKDNITNAYAAALEDNGHFVVTFGMDRFDTSGDAQLGFWFLQDQVAPISGGSWSGKHINGDVLVLANFSNGGDVPTIEVWKWQNGTAVQISAADAALCVNGWLPNGVSHCGITNNQAVTAPWVYFNKDVGGQSNTFPVSAFFEGALDLTALGLDNACFTRFVAESRSSTSITATLKDFAGGAFPVCSISVSKTCTTPVLSPDESKIIYNISGMVTNKGFGTLSNVALSDNPSADGDFSWVNCNNDGTVLGTFPLTSLARGATACYKNTMSVPLSANGTSDTVKVTSNTKSDGTGVAVNDSITATCPNLQINPSLSVSKSCSSSVEVQNGKVVAKVSVSGQVCNTGKLTDGSLSNVTVSDMSIVTTPNPLLSNISLIPGQCKTYTGTYYPSAAQDTNGIATTDPHAVIFKDAVKATATDVFGKGLEQTDKAECPLCK